jgi:hypothetical protein
MPHLGKEKNDENLWMMMRTWTDWKPIREPLGASGLKEEEVGAVGENPQQERPSHKMMSRAETSERKER